MTDHTDNVGDGTTATTASTASATTATAATTTAGPDSPRTVRIATVVWGFILLGIAALFFTLVQFDLTHFNPGVVAAWAVIGIGALAIVGGLVGAVMRRR